MIQTLPSGSRRVDHRWNQGAGVQLYRPRYRNFDIGRIRRSSKRVVRDCAGVTSRSPRSAGGSPRSTPVAPGSPVRRRIPSRGRVRCFIGDRTERPASARAPVGPASLHDEDDALALTRKDADVRGRVAVDDDQIRERARRAIPAAVRIRPAPPSPRRRSTSPSPLRGTAGPRGR